MILDTSKSSLGLPLVGGDGEEDVVEKGEGIDSFSAPGSTPAVPSGQPPGSPRMIMVNQAMGLLLLATVAVAWTSPPAIWTRPAFTGAGVQLAELPGSEASCVQATGGTCFVGGCAADRGNTTCRVTPGIKFAGWHTCDCQYPTPCAHSNGTCHASPEKGWRMGLRGESEWFLGFALAPIMRSGVTQVFTKFFAFDHMISIPQPPLTLDYTDEKYGTWDGIRMASNFQGHRYQAYFVSAVKLAGFHCMQPMLFMLPYAAYSHSMGWVQFTCATVVVVGEVWYLYIIVRGAIVNPRWLLYAPLSDERSYRSWRAVDGPFGDDGYLGRMMGPAWYFAGPATFISSSIGDSTLIIISGFGQAFVSVCAYLAIVIGLAGHGVMYPSLLVGYMLAAFELPTLIIGASANL
mmetsp:Transcript_23358/g.66407  ORF Transcript_23358/g.66407 Transcript_23358/m.66407 type:complete len:405 (+) Transcript_23358:135-1349(+)